LGEHCSFTIDREIVRTGPCAHDFSTNDFPTARLDLTLENFSLDCFYWVDSHSFYPDMFASQDLKDAMALGLQDVQYLPVDASGSAPLPRSKNYMIMHVTTVENITDREQSIYHDTTGNPERPIFIGAIAIKADADPKHDIFRDEYFSGFVFCTDALAVRVLQRQCSGIRFVDPWDQYNPIRFRSLRGTEEESRFADQKVSHAISKSIETGRVTDSHPYTGAGGIYTSYSGHIPDVQFAAVYVLMCPLRTTRANSNFLVRLKDESLCSDAGEIITSAELLNALERSSERDAVWTAIAKFQLHAKFPADILAARAYVWASNFAPGNFADVPANGPALEFVALSIMLVERACPGTLYLALRGNRLSIDHIRNAAEEGLGDATDIES
jgi:hypothetical protein